MSNMMRTLLAMLLLSLPATALASGPPGPNTAPSTALVCGTTIPKGSYKNECEMGRWTDEDRFTVVCTPKLAPVGKNPQVTELHASCEEVTKCNFSFALEHGPKGLSLRCE